MRFNLTGKYVGHWDVVFTDKQHASLMSEPMNVGTEWPIVNGVELYSNFHFYLIDGRWTCKHPKYECIHIKRVCSPLQNDEPTEKMKKALVAAMESQFHDWAVQQQDEIKEAHLTHLGNRMTRISDEMDDLRKQLKEKEKELSELIVEKAQFMVAT